MMLLGAYLSENESASISTMPLAQLLIAYEEGPFLSMALFRLYVQRVRKHRRRRDELKAEADVKWIRTALQPDCRVGHNAAGATRCKRAVRVSSNCIQFDSLNLIVGRLDFTDFFHPAQKLQWLPLHVSTSRTCMMSADW